MSVVKLVYYPPDFLWPPTVPRSRQRSNSWRYTVSLDAALKDLRAEIGRWRPQSGDAEIGIDRARSIADHGVVVRFIIRDGRQICAACDRYTNRMPNIRAITLFLEALRRMERDGCQQLIEQMARGQVFTAIAPPSKWPWSQLGLAGRPESKETLDAAYRARAKECHPDQGGDPALMTKLNEARGAALKAMGLS